MTRVRSALIAGGLLLAAPGLAQAQAPDWEFCEKLTLALSTSHDAEPFTSLLQDQTKPKGYATLVMPGFDRCYVGRMGAEPPGVATFACRKNEAPAELTARALLAKIAVCLEREPEFDDQGAAFFAASPTRVSTEELTFGDKRTVVFKVEVVEGPAAERRPLEEALFEDAPADEAPAEETAAMDAVVDAAPPQDAAAEEAPVEAAAAEEALAEDPPAEDPSAEDISAEEPPAVDDAAPADDWTVEAPAEETEALEETADEPLPEETSEQ